MFVYFLSPEFPPTPYLQPQALAPVQSLTLALSSERTSEMPLAALAEGAALICLQIRISGHPSPGLSCCCFISQEPRHLFSNGVVFLELKSSSALRGTSLWMWPHLEPGPDWKRAGPVPRVSPAHAVPPLGLSAGFRTPSVCLVQLNSFLPGLGPGGLVGRAHDSPSLW